MSPCDPGTVLAGLPRDVVTQARLLIASGWPLEAERILAEATDGRTGKRLVAYLVRQAIIK